jgi:hypothetical protein
LCVSLKLRKSSVEAETVGSAKIAGNHIRLRLASFLGERWDVREDIETYVRVWMAIYWAH